MPVPFVPVELGAKFIFNQTLFGQSITNGIWLERTDDSLWTGATLEEMCNVLFAWWNDNLSIDLSDDLTLENVTAREYSVEAGAYAASTVGTASGQVIGESEAPNVACSIKFATAKVGRSYRGRNYIAGIPTTDVDGMTIQGDFILALEASYGLLPVTISAYDARHVVVSTKQDGVWLTEGVVTPVQSYNVPTSRVRTQRRRV